MGKKSPIFLFLWEKDDIFARKRCVLRQNEV